MWSAVSHFLSFTLGTIAGVTLMCLLQGAAHVERSITFSVFHAWHNRRRNFDVSAAGRKADRRAVYKIL